MTYEKAIEAHKVIASEMTLEQLITIIEEIKATRDEMAPHLKTNELREIDDVIKIYRYERDLEICLMNSDNYSDLTH